MVVKLKNRLEKEMLEQLKAAKKTLKEATVPRVPEENQRKLLDAEKKRLQADITAQVKAMKEGHRKDLAEGAWAGVGGLVKGRVGGQMALGRHATTPRLTRQP